MRNPTGAPKFEHVQRVALEPELLQQPRHDLGDPVERPRRVGGRVAEAVARIVRRDDAPRGGEPLDQPFVVIARARVTGQQHDRVRLRIARLTVKDVDAGDLAHRGLELPSTDAVDVDAAARSSAREHDPADNLRTDQCELLRDVAAEAAADRVVRGKRGGLGGGRGEQLDPRPADLRGT